jgi:hypothetical protein
VRAQRRLSVTLKEALGEREAFSLMPRTFALPDETAEWRAWVQQQEAARLSQPQGQRGPERLWVLKTAQHLGKGLKLLPGTEAVQEAGKAR